jgi:PmbA protein
MDDLVPAAVQQAASSRPLTPPVVLVRRSSLTDDRRTDTVPPMPEPQTERLVELAAEVVERARRAGADTAESVARAGWELNTRVRLGDPELVEEAGQRGVELRVIKDQRVAMTTTSDLTPAGIGQCVSDALMLADLSQPDEAAGPADPEQLGSSPFAELELFDPAVAEVDAAAALDRAKRAEAAALGCDERLSLSEGASFSRMTIESAMVLSGGFTGTLRGSYASLVVTPVAEDGDGKRRRGFYWTARRHLHALETEEAVGREAARRTLAKLGARQVSTCEASVVFDPDAARSILGTFAGCILGGAIWRKSSYLVDREGSAVASPQVTIVDDPLLLRAPGSRPFDGEGLAARRNVVVGNGNLETYLLDCYSARKLARTSTGNATRGGGAISPATTNFVMQPGTIAPDDLIRSTQRGLYVTDMMGFGFNSVTGDFSRGASGFWIENGELTFPVSEVTISSNLDTMLKSIDAIANDLDLKTSTAAPTFRIAAMTIGGS